MSDTKSVESWSLSTLSGYTEAGFSTGSGGEKHSSQGMITISSATSQEVSNISSNSNSSEKGNLKLL